MLPVSDNKFPKLVFSESAAPASPPADHLTVYLDTAGILQTKDSTGAVTTLAVYLDPVAKQAADPTLTALAGANWANNSIPVGNGSDSVTQLLMGANQFFARNSTGGVNTHPITDPALAALANMTASTAYTPTSLGSTTAGVGTYTTQTGAYIRSGSIVSFRQTVTHTAHTGTGNMRFGDLPFTAAAGFNTPVTIGQCDNFAVTAGSQLIAEVIAGTTQIRILAIPSGGGVSAGVAIDVACTFTISGFYFV